MSQQPISTHAHGAEQPDALGRRRFVMGASIAATALGMGARAQAATEAPMGPGTRLTIGNTAAGAPSRMHPSFVKDVGRLQDLNPTHQAGAYWDFDTCITPVEDFNTRNALPTPRPELDRRVDPRFWRLRIHGDAVERPIEISYVGLKPDAKAVLFWSGVDGTAPNTQSDTGRPTPISEVTGRSGVIGLAFKVNGKPLPVDHGAPVRREPGGRACQRRGLAGGAAH